mmetsp:Transcript_70175/g.139159  ORF Transcript_70175/g.139159 Transcript_70175/m.139159 type:complete len:206 (+) Transcript_70175:58-675(+)
MGHGLRGIRVQRHRSLPVQGAREVLLEEGAAGGDLGEGRAGEEVGAGAKLAEPLRRREGGGRDGARQLPHGVGLRPERWGVPGRSGVLRSEAAAAIDRRLEVVVAEPAASESAAAGVIRDARQGPLLLPNSRLLPPTPRLQHAIPRVHTTHKLLLHHLPPLRLTIHAMRQHSLISEMVCDPRCPDGLKRDGGRPVDAWGGLGRTQ